VWRDDYNHDNHAGSNDNDDEFYHKLDHNHANDNDDDNNDESDNNFCHDHEPDDHDDAAALLVRGQLRDRRYIRMGRLKRHTSRQQRGSHNWLVGVRSQRYRRLRHTHV